MHVNDPLAAEAEYCGTSYAGKLLGLSVGTIQHLVEKNELQAWKTNGGHRRILMSSIRNYQHRHSIQSSANELRSKMLRVLVVEDDAVTRELLADYCSRSSMPIDCTAMASGLEALVDIASIKPDLLITDLKMPGVDGFELLRALHRNPQFKLLTTLVLSALTPQEIEAKGGLPEGILYMTKPINMDWFNGFLTAMLTARSID